MSTRIQVEAHEHPWEGAVENWAKKYAAANEWRTLPVHDRADLVQDAFTIYLDCSRRYWYEGNEKRFMALFMRSFVNEVNDLSNERTDEATTETQLALAGGMETFEQGSPEIPDALSLEDAPNIVRKLVDAFEDQGRLPHPLRERADGTRETLNQRLCRMAGVDPRTLPLGIDLRQVVSNHVRGIRNHV